MTQIKERAVGIIQRIPEEKMMFVFNILQNVEKVLEWPIHASDEEDLAERQAAYQRLLKYKGKLHRHIDYKQELAEYRDEKYGHSH